MSPCRSLLVGAALSGLALLACRDDARESEVRASAELDRLERCVALFAEIDATPANARASAIAERVPESDSCAQLFAGCAWEPGSPSSMGAIDSLADGCLDAYCPRLDPRPRLCDDPDASDIATAEVERVFAEFVAAKLALDLGLPRDHPRIVGIAGAIGPIWAIPVQVGRIRVSPPRTAPPPDEPL